MKFERKTFESARHRTAYLEAGPADGPLMIFVHGWPEAPFVWIRQIEHFAAQGWRCIAPWMRGYGASSVPGEVAAYANRETVGDLVELHGRLGGAPAVWIGHDWGSPVVWALAGHHPERCRGVASASIPYLARGFALPALVPLLDREIYPVEDFPVGQWDYWLAFREHFNPVVRAMEESPEGILRLVFQPSQPLAETRGPAFSANARQRGGLFGGIDLAHVPGGNLLLEAEYVEEMARDLAANGFSGPIAWYLNDDANMDYARQAVDFGRLSMPVLFLHGARDDVCETVRSRLAEPMREDCSDLTEVVIDAGHQLALEDPGAVNQAIAYWLAGMPA
ncbi:alpha/beta fold hydrolase [Stakelama pacifica]|uniref:Pimeloyl-ACP methyl ester carboxylesterase n=1 Tax=Stakelama pacifica TaxID=517720 RepID=A0A4R6FMN6_9SPHN|nr:alpha/beta hydrolase [Stakelama pacifica]TDN82832.1 pimeloyl-ACP methyl ester carboxylesterase [Stakelama pacifica]GGO95463.1 epoxide hydrolase [Stakelama pacifica]